MEPMFIVDAVVLRASAEEDFGIEVPEVETVLPFISEYIDRFLEEPTHEHAQYLYDEVTCFAETVDRLENLARQMRQLIDRAYPLADEALRLTRK